jgi:uncharacterized membrane protein YgdD (TMEM256/DUF423 family)
MARLFLTLAALSGLLAVALGAFGAHGLKQRLPVDMMAVYQTGVQYHFWHTLALLGVGILLLQGVQGKLVVASGWLFIAGILLFSGSLYVLAITGVRSLGMITPVGGVFWIAAWLCLALGVWRM